jgi:hypothetical protein
MMRDSRLLGLALRDLSACIDGLTFYATTAPTPEPLSDECEQAKRWEVQDRCARANNLALQAADERAAAEHRIQTFIPELVGLIGDARRKALTFITLLASRPDLASTHYDRWPGRAHRESVDELQALSKRFRSEGMAILTADSPALISANPSPTADARPLETPGPTVAARSVPMTAAQIAEELGITEDAAQGRLKRAREANLNCFYEVNNRRATDPKYLYFRDIVWPMIE